MPGVFAGIVTGVFVFVVLALKRHDPIMGLNAGFVGLCCNAPMVVTVSLFTRTGRCGFDEIAHSNNLGQMS